MELCGRVQRDSGEGSDRGADFHERWEACEVYGKVHVSCLKEEEKEEISLQLVVQLSLQVVVFRKLSHPQEKAKAAREG